MLQQRRLSRDVYVKEMWKRCTRIPSVYTATYWDSGAVYLSTRDMRRSRACYSTPILIEDSEGERWTEAVHDFKSNYLAEDGSPITEEFVKSLIGNDSVNVIANVAERFWVFHVSTEVYGYKCPFGANRPNVYRGSGDYLVCKGYDGPDLSTVRVVHTDTFDKQYKIEEGDNVFEYKNSMWRWDGKEYSDINDALRPMCERISWSKGVYTPEFGDVGVFVTNKLALIYAIYNLSMYDVLNSEHEGVYRKLTGNGFGMLKYLERNPLYAKIHRLPIGYECNKSMQIAMFPKLGEIYGQTNMMVETKRGKYPFDTVLSYICDRILFNATGSPFDGALKIFIELEKHPATSGLSNYCRHEDLDRLKILAMQVRDGDVTTEEPITIGDVRACRYPSATRDKVGAGVDYVNSLIYSPPSLFVDNYQEWSNTVLQLEKEVQTVVNIVPEVEQKAVELSPVADLGEVIKTAEEEDFAECYVEEQKPVFEDYMNPPEIVDVDNQNMHNVAYVYCNICGADIDSCREILNGFGVEKWEDFYRALPIYLRRTGKGVYENVLIEYCNLLKVNYGSCTLRFD